MTKVNINDNASTLESQASANAQHKDETHSDDIKKSFISIACDASQSIDKNESNTLGAKTKSFDDKLKLEVSFRNFLLIIPEIFSKIIN